MSQDLTQGSIAKHIQTITIPASVGFFFSTMYNIIDTYFAGRIGDEALAGMSASFAAFFIIIAVSMGIATATTSLVANHLGSKNYAEAKEYYLHGIIMGLIGGLTLTVLGIISAKPLLSVMHLSPEVLKYALDFLYVTFAGTIFFVMAGVLNSYLNAIGNTKVYRNLLIASVFLNILLDPWLLYGGFGVPALGIGGIALGTVIVQILECIYLVIYLRKQKIFEGLTNGFKLQTKILKELFFQAVPSSLNMMNVAIGSYIINYFIAIFGANALAGYGVAIRIEQIALIPAIGLNIAALSIIGQNNGAKKFDRVRETIKTSLYYGLYIFVFSMIVILGFGKYIFLAFTTSTEISSIGMHYLYFALAIFMAYIISFVTSSALQGIKFPNRALIANVLRQIILPIIIFPLMIYTFNLGMNGLWWALLVVNWIGAIVSIYITNRSIKARELESKTV